MLIKKKGFVLLESIIALGFLLILFEFGLNIAFNNFSKGKLYYNYEDRRTLSFEENRIINKLNLYVNENKNESENEKKYNKAKEDAMKGEKEEIFYTDLEYKNYYVIINDKYINIVEERSNQRRYVELIEKKKDNKIYFIPSGYRIDFVVKG